MDSFPEADIFTMGTILHGWGPEHKKLLIDKAYEALPKGGLWSLLRISLMMRGPRMLLD